MRLRRPMTESTCPELWSCVFRKSKRSPSKCRTMPSMRLRKTNQVAAGVRRRTRLRTADRSCGGLLHFSERNRRRRDFRRIAGDRFGSWNSVWHCRSFLSRNSFLERRLIHFKPHRPLGGGASLTQVPTTPTKKQQRSPPRNHPVSTGIQTRRSLVGLYLVVRPGAGTTIPVACSGGVTG